MVERLVSVLTAFTKECQECGDSLICPFYDPYDCVKVSAEGKTAEEFRESTRFKMRSK